jgi:hypothetical protein
MQSGKRLLFVYNADSEAVPNINDHMRRTTYPSKETCNLLAMTFSPVGIKKEWKRFLSSLPVPARFMARDDFTSEFPAIATTFPVAFLQDGDGLYGFITTEEINRCRELEDLIALIRQRHP